MTATGQPHLQLVYSNGEAIEVKPPSPIVSKRPHCPGIAPQPYYPALIAVQVDGDALGVRVSEDGSIEFIGGYVPDRVTEQLWNFTGQALAKLLPRPGEQPRHG